MKTLSVKQVAECLGVSPRAVIKRLSNEQLKGVRRPNKYGVEEWWVYPNKEIRAALESAGKSDILIDDGGTATDAEVVDVYTENFSPEQDEQANDEETEAPKSTLESVKGSVIAEELWNNIIGKFVGQLQERDVLIGVMKSEIAEKDRQLRLLPDLERAATLERESAQLKALEAEALRKQIAALQETVEQRLPPEIEQKLVAEKAAKEQELQLLKSELDHERKTKETQLAALKEELSTVQEYKKLAEDAQRKFDALELVIEERVQTEREASTNELRRIQEEKERETAAIKAQLDEIAAKLDKPAPWWKKFLGLEG